MLLWNTVRLTVACTVLCAVLGVGAAWLVERTDLPLRRLWAVLLVLPLGVPDFVIGFGWISIDPGPARLPGGGDDHDAVALSRSSTCRSQRR